MTLVVAIDGDPARQLPIELDFSAGVSERIAAILSTCIAGRGGRVSGTKGHSTCRKASCGRSGFRFRAHALCASS